MTEQEYKMDPSTVKKLANRVKACTFLPYARPTDWTTGHAASAVEEFVRSDQRRALCLYYEDGALKADFGAPAAAGTDAVMWFLKTSSARLDCSNFARSVSFGKTDGRLEKSMFLLWDSLYSPFVFSCGSGSAGEKDRFFEQYRAVIQELCSLRYKFLGMPSIYVPTIVGRFDETTKNVSEETLRVLENIINAYILEIQNCLMDNERVPGRCEYMMEHIVDEINYWKNRRSNLRFISTLLSYKSVDLILTILKQHQSILVDTFNNITDEIEVASIECASNLDYLHILLEPITNLYNVNSPNDILPQLPDIFVRFIFIFEESPYYNKWSDMNRLYEFLGNQIVYICRKTVKMSELFSGDTESVLNKLEVSMNCCENYISVYTKVIEIYNSINDGHWSVETRDVHMFLDRCRDVNYICKSMVLFKRLNKSNPIPKPRFSFTKGLEFERVVESVESRFNKLIDDLENVQNVIFNVNSTEWYQHELKFKGEVKELCSAVERLLDDALAVACNAEDALNVLQSLHYFSGWPQLNSHFRTKTDQVCAALIDEISFATRFYGDAYLVPSFMARCLGACVTAATQHRRITSLKNMIFERPWLLSCTNIEKLRELYKNYTNVYREMVINTFETWVDQSNSNHEQKFEKKILIGNRNDQYWHLTINMDCHTLDFLSDMEYWSLFGFEKIFTQNEVVKNSSKIKRLHRNVTKIVNDYNTFIAGLSEQEMLLFIESIESCNKITSPMIQCYTWKHLELDGYLLGCYNELESAQNFVDDYKNCNIEIVEICEEISNSTLLKINKQQILTLKDLKRKIEIVKNNSVLKIIESYNQIADYLTFIYNGFGENIDNIAVYWIHYVEKIDSLVCEALILNCRHSLENVLQLTAGNGSGPTPVLVIHVSLEGDKIKYSSSLAEILAFSANFFTDLLSTVKEIPRLSHSFKRPQTERVLPYEDEISKDWICTRLQEKNNLATINALRQLRRYMQEYLSYEDIWSINKTLFFENYNSLNPLAVDFDRDMTQYSIYKRKILCMKPVAQRAHFLVDTNALKDQIVKHCDEWRDNFSKSLLKITVNLIDGLYQYAQTNSVKVMTPPVNVNEMIAFVELRKIIVSEYEEKTREFTLISDNVKVLEANNVRLSESMCIKYEQLFNVWTALKNTLEDAEIMLKKKQNDLSWTC